MKRRRNTDVFGLSFLDCICCGFGAVILLFVIVNSRTDEPPTTVLDVPKMTEAERKREEDLTKLRIQQTQREIGQLKDDIAVLDVRLADATKHRDAVIERIAALEQQINAGSTTATTSQAEVEKLKDDLRALEVEIKQLRAAIRVTQEKQDGDRVRAMVGDGYRHYLTGLSLSGQRTLILLDCSASMLSDRIVDIIRRRNRDASSRRNAPKWKQAVAAVDWLLTELPIDGQFQLYGFNEKAFPVVASSDGTWLNANDKSAHDTVTAALYEIVPEDGTNLHSAMELISTLSPLPDNIVLIADGLPTIGKGISVQRTVSGKRRAHHFQEAVKLLPRGLPVNVILYQMEGDPQAAAAYWALARASRGSFFCPSRDWP